MCVLATMADMSYWPALLWQGTPAPPETLSAHSQAVLHRRWLARKTHAHKHTYAPFRGDINPLSIQGKKIYLYHCNGTFCVKCHFSNVYGQLTGTGFFAAAPGLVSMVRCVVLRHLHPLEMQQWQPGGWGEKRTKYINKTKGRKRKQKGRGKKPQTSRSLQGFDTVHSSSDNWVLSLNELVSSQWQKKNLERVAQEKKDKVKVTLSSGTGDCSTCVLQNQCYGRRNCRSRRLVYVPLWSIWSIGRAMRTWKQNLIGLLRVAKRIASWKRKKSLKAPQPRLSQLTTGKMFTTYL